MNLEFLRLLIIHHGLGKFYPVHGGFTSIIRVTDLRNNSG